jgi:serine/threonine-protein kinase haspin
MADTIRALTAPAADPASDDGLVRKIGEGTYGEAFKIGGTVLKIVPAGGDALINGEPQMGPAQIRAEAAVAKRLAKLRGTEASSASSRASSCAPSNDASSSAPLNATAGFIDTRAVRVCRGPYAPALLRAWAASDAVARSENENPAHFAADQTYVVFACADGGADLEHVELRTFAEACAVLLQVTTALAVAEEACRFEHRDLHWGNVLLRRCGADETRTARLNGVDVTVDTAGLEVSIIDFTLSRLDGRDGGGDEDEDESAAVFCDLNADPELFAGPEGHCQSDTYRKMRDATGGRWERHCPKTNALWLRYLADCLAEDKAFSATKEQRGEMRRFRKRCTGYESAADALWDELFVGKFTTGTSLGR